jgi:hypothetical protein
MMTRVFFFLARPPSLPFIIFYTTISESIFFFLISYSFLSLYCIFFFGSSILTWLSFHPLNVFFSLILFFFFVFFVLIFYFQKFIKIITISKKVKNYKIAGNWLNSVEKTFFTSLYIFFHFKKIY